MIPIKNVIFTLAIHFSLVTLSAQSSTLTLLFAGDIMGHDSQIASALAMGSGTHDYRSDFNLIQSHISRADIAIGNLEVTFAGAPYKGYPAFSSPDALAGALKSAGFDIMVNANNHALDRGRSGLERTLEVVGSAGLVQTGVFKDPADRAVRYPLIVEKKGIRLALLNYTYGTNGIRVTPPNIVNSIDTALIRLDLQKAVTAAPDFTVVLMHWGLEYARTENSVQQELASFLFANGADAIIGSHPHVVQPIREYSHGRLVVYSLGNMISNQRKRYTDGGILFGMTLEKRDSTCIASYDYLPVWVHKAQTEKGTDFRLIPAATDSSLWGEMSITPEDGSAMQLFLEDTRENLEGIPERAPY